MQLFFNSSPSNKQENQIVTQHVYYLKAYCLKVERLSWL